jgi:hypothetical protein
MMKMTEDLQQAADGGALQLMLDSAKLFESLRIENYEEAYRQALWLQAICKD